MNDTHKDEDDNEGKEKDTSPQATTEALGTSFRISALGLDLSFPGHETLPVPQLNPQGLQRARQLLEDQPCFLPWIVVQTQ